MANILNVEVSAFANAMATKPVAVNMYEWLTSPNSKALVDRIRNEVDPDKKAQLKKQLPAITPSGTFRKRLKEGLLKHSGFICVDIDMEPNLGVDNFSDLKSLIMELECVAYCSLSASGKGYFALIPISQPTKHKEHFESLKLDFSVCGIKIDESCSDVTRLRFASYDEQPYINQDATPYNKIIPTKTAYKARSLNSIMKKGDAQKSVEDLINKIEEMGVDITEGYKNWFTIGCSIVKEFGEEGREYYHRICQFHQEYDSHKVNKQYTACMNDKNTHTIATLFWCAQQHGVILTSAQKDFNSNNK